MCYSHSGIIYHVKINVYISYVTNILIAFKTMIRYNILVYLSKHIPATSNIQSLSGTVEPSKSTPVVSHHVEWSQKGALQVIQTTFQFLLEVTT